MIVIKYAMRSAISTPLLYYAVAFLYQSGLKAFSMLTVAITRYFR